LGISLLWVKNPCKAAVMRKLLHALHGMLTNNQPFDNTRFYAMLKGNVPESA
jgi:transposase